MAININIFGPDSEKFAALLYAEMRSRGYNVSLNSSHKSQDFFTKALNLSNAQGSADFVINPNHLLTWGLDSKYRAIALETYYLYENVNFSQRLDNDTLNWFFNNESIFVRLYETEEDLSVVFEHLKFRCPSTLEVGGTYLGKKISNLALIPYLNESYSGDYFCEKEVLTEDRIEILKIKSNAVDGKDFLIQIEFEDGELFEIDN